jgi:hypothetical protein
MGLGRVKTPWQARNVSRCVEIAVLPDLAAFRAS